MTTIAIDLDDAGRVVKLLRLARFTLPDDENVLRRFADAIEAVADNRVIVLDVDALGLDSETDRIAMRNWSESGGNTTAARIVTAVANALDSLTPPRPWAVGGTVVMFEDSVALRTDAGTWRCSCGQTHDDDQIASDLERKRARIVEDGNE